MTHALLIALLVKELIGSTDFFSRNIVLLNKNYIHLIISESREWSRNPFFSLKEPLKGFYIVNKNNV